VASRQSRAIRRFPGARRPWSSDGTWLTKLFAQMNTGGALTGGYNGGDLKNGFRLRKLLTRRRWLPNGLPMLAYEGGQGFTAFPTYFNGSPIVNLYMIANRDPRQWVLPT